MFTFRRKQKNKHIVITDAVVTVKKRDYIILKPTGDLDISILIYPERFPAMQFEQDGLDCNTGVW